MKIGILCYYLSPYSGETRAALNLAKGLEQLGNEAQLITVFSNRSLAHIMKNADLKLTIGNYIPECSFPSYTSHLILDLLFGSMAKKLHRLILNSEPCDIYLLANDEAIPISRYKGDRKIVYWSQGAWPTLFFSEAWYSLGNIIKRFASIGTVELSLRYSKMIKSFDMVLANSRLAREIVALFYNRLPEGIVYPPVDMEKFRPTQDIFERDYALAVMERPTQEGKELLEAIASYVKLKVVGNVRIKGAEILGRVSDEELCKLYSGALVTLYPITFEYFGYIPVESMACGTPVIAFNSGGPSETIVDGETGWLVNSKNEFINKVLEVCKKGYPKSMKEKARKRAELFSIERSAKELVKYLEALARIHQSRASFVEI